MNFVDNIDKYFEELMQVIDVMDREQINNVMNKLVEVNDRGGSIYIFGNGGSAATASHFVVDFNKGVSEKLSKKFKFICLNDNIPSLTAISNDIAYNEVFKFQLQNYLTEKDMVIGISGSGNSENVVQAIQYANDKGAATIALVGYNGGKLKKCAQNYIHVPIDDMQKVEDIHMVLDHMMMTILKEYLLERYGVIEELAL
ncbi:D-sedoheptulose-7-phosphate isomerase [Inconstantimicrobium mannanitabidum]|uniref:Phosphoheptose isomerase n=1 Tax=Inconstantimicrobium mannanitabidum TaxID=1604901 RepID=A0ACB5REP2_9CLOT|nr:SIS domain-containing protein [Clostridium sp. TW13]GKX67359.1 phosphoheptose isomerase [Clostridium sp. TW13]